MDTPGLFIRLYLDENVFPDLAAAIRQRGFDSNWTTAGEMRNAIRYL